MVEVHIGAGPSPGKAKPRYSLGLALHQNYMNRHMLLVKKTSSPHTKVKNCIFQYNMI